LFGGILNVPARLEVMSDRRYANAGSLEDIDALVEVNALLKGCVEPDAK
jgi:hypothetical protein